MTTRRLCLAATLSAAALAALPAAAAQRTFVASYGNDSNPCTLTSPCRSFTRALTQTDAGGEVLVLDSAGYGAFTIAQTVSVIAPDGVYAGISVFPGQHGVVVNGVNIRVTLRGLTLNGQGGDDGIRIENAGDVFIERVSVANTGISAAGIRVAAGATGARVFVTDTTVSGSGYGILLQANATLQVNRCRIEANELQGILGHGSGGSLAVTGSLVARNGVGVQASGSAGSGTFDVTVSGSTLHGNTVGIVVLGSSGSTANYRVAIVDNVVGRSVQGIDISGVAGETATGLVADNRIVDNIGFGIRCTGAGSMVLIAERNAVVGNGRAFEQGGGCTFESLGNNAARGNNNADTGTITPVTLR